MNEHQSLLGNPSSDEERAMKPHERFEYSAILDRQPLKLPRGARLVIWPVVNVEEWEITRPMPRGVSMPPGGQAIVPDIQNWGWHEYGMRVGIWRLMESLHRHRITPTLAINARVCETRPRIAEAARDADWEFMAHSYVQMPIHKLEDQRATMRQCVEVIRKYTGKAPAGWLGPGRGQTYATLDYIAEAGFKYFGDWVMDDQPFYVKTMHGPVVAVPYSVELNDITIMLTHQHQSDVMLKRARDAFDQIYRESRTGARVIAFGVHPYISGAAHRIRYFDEMLRYFKKHKGVVFWTGEKINDWYRDAVKS
ncbi:MAG: polysaccharide deacetylase family protein [Betaproteobacteria bacterium]|nr:polysaccharide deacetylase family protein [Betaproteobacteria bacterium]MDH3437684.1 polysaccharide deacetylase family protein [Betaproteobacteria bacterium]